MKCVLLLLLCTKCSTFLYEIEIYHYNNIALLHVVALLLVLIASILLISKSFWINNKNENLK